MNKKIDYGIGVIILIGAILVLLGYSLLIYLLTVTDHLTYTFHEWRELLGRVDPGTSARLDFGLNLFVYGIIITVVGNGIALARIFIKRDMDKKIDYGIGVILITGAIFVIYGISLVYYTLVTDNILEYFYWEWYEIEVSMSEGTVALFYFYLYLFVYGIIISIVGNCIALARIFIKKKT